MRRAARRLAPDTEMTRAATITHPARHAPASSPSRAEAGGWCTPPQTTHCAETPAWTGRWFLPRGERWFRVWARPDHLDGLTGSESSACDALEKGQADLGSRGRPAPTTWGAVGLGGYKRFGDGRPGFSPRPNGTCRPPTRRPHLLDEPAAKAKATAVDSPLSKCGDYGGGRVAPSCGGVASRAKLHLQSPDRVVLRALPNG